MKAKNLMIINVALVLLAVLLILNFFNVGLPTLGRAGYYIDRSEPVCVVSYNEESSLLRDTGLCCVGLQSQLRCEDGREEMLVDGEQVVVNKKCFTGEKGLSYKVNMKTYNYCKKEGYLGYSVI